MRIPLLLLLPSLAAAAPEGLPFAFEENLGQWPGEVAFAAHGPRFSVALAADGVTLTLAPEAGRRAQVQVTPLGATATPPVGHDRRAGRANYLLGAPEQHRAGVQRFGSVRQAEVYPGVDLVWHGENGALEYDFVVAPGADPTPIRLGLRGAAAVRLTAEGDLAIETTAGTLHQRAPVAFQEVEGRRIPVAARFEVAGDEVAFALGAYDPNRALVIDPVVDYATYLGGTNGEIAHGMDRGPDGDFYLSGYTTSPNFPFENGPIAPAFGPAGVSQAQGFIARIDPTQPGPDGLVWVTYIGGLDPNPGATILYDVAVDAQGRVYGTGYTSSHDLPVVGGFAQHPSDHNNGYLVRLDPTGQAIQYSTYIGGGTNVEEMFGLDVDDDGHAYVVGRTASYDFPTKNGFKPAPQDFMFDAVLLKIDADATGADSLLYSTAFGGSGSDSAEDVVIDAQGRAWLMGTTQSYGNAVNTPLPTTGNAFQANLGGSTDLFVAGFDPAIPGQLGLLFSSYLGGSYPEDGFAQAGGIARDTDGYLYVTGGTQSPNFPVTPGAYDTTQNAVFPPQDATLTKIDPFGATAADTLVWSTYFGGTANDLGSGIAIGPDGDVWITGMTVSANLPVGPCVGPKDNASSGFVARFTSDGAFVFARFYGGLYEDRPLAIDVIDADTVAIAGWTSSQNLATTPDALQPVFAKAPVGFNDAFFSILADMECPAPPTAVDDAYGTGFGGTVTVAAPGVLANDVDPNDDGLTAELLTGPAVGALTFAADGGFQWQPPAGFSGQTTFTYRAYDLGGLFDDATVTLSVGAPTTPPPCDPDTLSALEVPGLTPVFAPLTFDYGVPVPQGGAIAVTPTACDPAVLVHVQSTPVAAGQTFGAWVGDGGPVDIVLYRNWQEINRYTLTLDAALPEPPPAPVVASITAPGLVGFEPAVTDYDVPAPAGQGLPITVTLIDPGLNLQIQSTPVASGATFTAWAPPGQAIDVVIYDGWLEVARYTIHVAP